MKKTASLLAALCCIAGGMTGCVSQSDYDSLQRRVQEQDAQLRQMQPAQADSWAQVQAMQQEMNQMKGQFDELQRAGGAKAIVEKLNRHEAALRQVETSMALNLNLDDSAAAGEAPAGQQQPLPGGQLTPPAQQDAAPQKAAQQQTAAPKQQAAPKKDTATALFEAGKADFSARKYTEARRSFSDFIKTYKSNPNVPDAQYYVAECHFQQNKFADAALAYDVVITKYAKSSKAPAAYLKQGICFSKLGQGAAAKARMQELIKKYPSSAEAARAKTFLKTNK
ncbi:MAG: tol-pal system protein YbgF [Desulfovibrionaceae bacterium]